MLKNLQVRLPQDMNHGLPDVQAGFKKVRGNSDQIANIRWIIKNAWELPKTCTSVLLTMLKLLTVWITINCGKIWKRWEYQITCPVSLRKMNAGQEATVRTEHGRTDWFQIGKEVHQGCILSPCLFNLMQSTSCTVLGWMTHKLESRLPGEISITSDI